MFKYNQKVKVPTTKSAGCSLEVSFAGNAESMGRDFMYFVGYRGKTNGKQIVALHYKPDQSSGDLWFENEVEAYVERKFKPGDKVKIPTKKSIGDSLRHSGVIKLAKENGDDFLIVKYYMKHNGQEVVVIRPDGTPGGDYFLESDLVPYKERKFKNGDKVRIPSKKSLGCRLEYSVSVNRANETKDEYMVVKSYEDYNGIEAVVITSQKRPHGGDYFLESDLELYPKFKVGDKVKIPTQKTGEYPGGSAVIKRARREGQDFLYVTGMYDENHYILRETFDRNEGDYFHLNDVTEAYEEPIFFTKEMNIGDFAIKPTGDGFLNPSGITITPWEPEGYSLEQLVKDSQKQTEDLQELLEKVQKLSEEQDQQRKEVLELKEQVDRLSEPVVPGVDYVQLKGITSDFSTKESVYEFEVGFYSGDVMKIEMGFSEAKLKRIWKNNQNVCGYVKGLFK